jgi:hypothetical protein
VKRVTLQIVPRAPGSREGVGDYAGILAKRLEEEHACQTVFATAADLRAPNWEPPSAASAIILHYVNYGYDARGVPAWLPGKLKRIQEVCGGKTVTIFHELFATSSWRRSAFWLQPVQKRIARLIAEDSAVCIVSSGVLAEQLKELTPAARILVRPVMSTFGEPRLSPEQLANRHPNRWVICGGTELIRRSLRSFPGDRELFVVGGSEQPEIRRRLDDSHYFPNIEAAAASAILASSAFGYLDYFETPDVPTAAVLKSTSFAAYCAHGVVPVFPSAGSAIASGDDALPGPFCLTNIPADSERAAVSEATYDWYQRHASSAHLAGSIAEAIAS